MTDEDDPDEELFAEAMRGVRPARKIVKRTQPTTARTLSVKPAMGQARPVSPPSISSSTPQTREEPWTLCASGVSRDRLRRLANGSYEREIDLHGSKRDEALRDLESVVSVAISQGVRALCIVHGRGLHSQGKPVLKQAVFQWLREGPYAAYVLAVVPKAGSGGGASMVLLRRDKR